MEIQDIRKECYQNHFFWSELSDNGDASSPANQVTILQSCDVLKIQRAVKLNPNILTQSGVAISANISVTDNRLSVTWSVTLHVVSDPLTDHPGTYNYYDTIPNTGSQVPSHNNKPQQFNGRPVSLSVTCSCRMQVSWLVVAIAAVTAVTLKRRNQQRPHNLVNKINFLVRSLAF